ncbi:Succinyl-diaminopimelate desuccinylase [Brevundimonas sp. NIBR10]|uniref:M20/M25/M40 family metallo-hydrolase n=1 Tax=Brevundimonas sp. NIBR10 TaxID=3015997 RepID=UPI0022F1CDB2|nr:M20/M25/M40 family metallo-hydrolase [Brevundimonas sp. NIBR10]WGM45707.1 Succinyl-diaminopimelate desuccinylase [Brevundimonas sp. NIBR10]
MTVGSSGAVAAMSLQAEKRITQALRDAGAVSPDTAIALAPGRLIQRGALRRLVRRSAVVEAGEGRYWLDDPAYQEMRNTRSSRAILLLFGLAAVLVIGAAVFVSKAGAQTPTVAPQPRPDQLAFRALYEELVETNTTLSEGDCTLASNRMLARLTAAGYSAEDAQVIVPEDQPKFGSLVATLKGSDASAPAILLLAHIDVVEARRSDWQRDPFTLVEEDGYFYARGASDDKAQASVWVDTFIRLKAEGFQPRRTLKMALTCGEETNDHWNGVQWLLEHRPETLSAGFALNEGAGGNLDADGNRLALNVQAGEKVYQDFTLTLTNPGGHSARPRKDNAIAAMGAGLDRLVRHDFPLEVTPVTRAYFTALIQTSPRFADDLRLLTAEVPDAAAALGLGAANPVWNAMLRTTCVPTLIEGGHAPNAQPQKVEVNVNCRILPGHTIAETQAEIERVLVVPGVTIATVGEPSPIAPPPPLTAEILDPVRQVAGRIWPGVPVVPTLSTGATDGRFTNAAGIPTYGMTGMFTDPDGNGVHGLNERLRVRSLYEGRDFLYEVVKLYAK